MATAGVIGLGNMGSVIVERLAAAGSKPLVYDISPEAMARCQAFGALALGSPKEVADGSEIVHVMVRDDADMMECVLGQHGALEGLSRGQVLLLHSTIMPGTTQKIGEAAKAKGVEVADVTITGRPAVLREGEAISMFGGDPELYERVKPHIGHITKECLYMGPLGAGNVTKIIHNLVSQTSRALVAECLELAEAAGVPWQRELGMIRKTKALDRLDSEYDPHEDNRDLGSAQLGLAKTLGEQYGVPLVITRLIADGWSPPA